MELNELDAKECAALAALVKFTVQADGVVTEEEEEEIGFIVSLIGEAAYQTALDTARTRVKDVAGLRALLGEVTRPEARELIYGTLVDVASPDSIDPEESKLLALLEEVWDIKPNFEGFPEDEGDDDPEGEPQP
jgi:hypothetical protein